MTEQAGATTSVSLVAPLGLRARVPNGTQNRLTTAGLRAVVLRTGMAGIAALTTKAPWNEACLENVERGQPNTRAATTLS